ncbi:hypothetical protein B7R22_17870 [Subtercola boreus]|uniref:ABC3 transporter permease C-terminal domain-containing protein n=1 Tax=Subtercola boreus TaxID=120213 RepID=A0A3E0VPX5_9MICO|nr:ABC transporter permease [Subtercola boreus]RFA11771.1 hypothetical protein B7R22_17870 [Subtercola boreus]
MIRMALRELRDNRSQHVATVIVALLGALLGTMLIEAEVMLTTQSSGGGFYVHPYVPLVLGVLGIIFVAVATFVAIIVTANTFTIVIAGRAKRIALFRLIGASSETLRRAVCVESIIVGTVGALLGTALGAALAAAVSGALIQTGVFLPLSTNFFPWELIFPILIGAASTGVAGWIGTSGIVSVSPIQALGRAREPALGDLQEAALKRRPLITWLLVGGFVILLSGVGIGYFTPYGLIVAFLGGAASFLGFVAGASAFLPPIMNQVGRLLGGSAAAKLAAANALRYPARSARSTIGLVIGVTLVTMFAVAGQTYFDVSTRIVNSLPSAAQENVSPFLGLVLGVIGILIGFSLAISAVGLINALSLSVLQRRREIGLLRALGLTRTQVRWMIFSESIQLTITGVICGLVLGTIYGWAGALTALSSDHHVGGYFWLSFPVWLLAAVIGAAAILAIIASLAPARRATQVPPVLAASVD